jgi:DNA replicative helicase MCM subunit Mcm2 (Cdc46/Mcm family)
MKEFIDKDGEALRLLTLEELLPNDEGKEDVLLQTIVAGSSEIEHYTRLIEFSCSECKDQRPYSYPEDFKDWRNMPTKKKCDRCNIDMYESQNTKGQLRKVLMTEQGTTNPIHLTGFIYGPDINKIQPGTKLNLNGILRSRKLTPKSLTFQRFFDITQFRLTDEKPLIPSDEEIEEFKTMDKTKLIESFAPHIRNMYLLKEGILLCCIGGVEGDNVRGDINALLLGDPGVAKTQLLKFMTKIIPKSDYVSGKSASGAGLFGGVDNLADGTRIGKPGSVTMCNGGMAAIDEIEKMNPADRTYCHEIMESQQFSLRKIGIDITWEVKVGIIAAGNPKKSRWNPELTIKENVNIPDSLLSRFGLIFLVRDIPNKSEDLAIANHIAMVRRGELTKLLEPQQITKFINYAKTLRPVETEECANVLTDWWGELRMEEQKEEALAIDIRTLEDLHRLTEAYARLDLTEIATEDHAHRAIKMLKDSLHTLGMNTPGEKNESLSKSFDKKGYAQYIFENGVTDAQAIAKLCEKPRWFSSEFEAKKHIAYLHEKGLISESGGKWTWV